MTESQQTGEYLQPIPTNEWNTLESGEVGAYAAAAAD